ncbi:hypothetical protein V7166_16515 [Bacillus thuringiensis]
MLERSQLIENQSKTLLLLKRNQSNIRIKSQEKYFICTVVMMITYNGTPWLFILHRSFLVPAIIILLRRFAFWPSNIQIVAEQTPQINS